MVDSAGELEAPGSSRTGGRVAAAIVLGAAWLAAMVIPLTSGAFWPIVAAREVLREHAVRFGSDPISELALRGDSWVVQPWLPALVQRGAWELGGIPGLVVLQGIVSVAFAALAWRIARGHAGPGAATIAVLACLVMELPTTLRTEQFALVIAAGLLLVLRSRAWWLAPLLLAVWANVHGSFVLGLALVVAAVLGLLRAPEERESPRLLDASWPARLGLVVASIAATLVNPLGPGVYAYVRSVSSVPQIRELAVVWDSLDPLGVRAVVLYVVLVPLLVARVLDARAHPRPRPGAGWLPTLSVLVLLLATFGSVRYSSWLALVLLPELASVLGDIARRAERPPVRPHILRPLAAISLVAIALGIALTLPGTDRQDGYAELGIPSPRMLDGVGRGDTVVASAEWADYIRLRTGAKVAVDARLERFRARDLRDYLRFREDADGALARRVGATWVLVHDQTSGDGWDDRGQELRMGGGPQLRRAEHSRAGDAFRVVP